MITLAENWADKIPSEEWAVYLPVIQAAQQQRTSFALGGGLAFSYYTGMWRNTKDLDLFVLPRDRDALIRILNDLDFTDYFDQAGYDRSWIYRGHKDGLIVDIIWQMANHRAEVDDRWLSGPEITMRGATVRIIPPEELIFAKLYVLQRDRCDWPDLLNVLFEKGEHLNWTRLMDRLDRDVPLLSALVHVFAWLCPQRAAKLPPLRALLNEHTRAESHAEHVGACEFDRTRSAFLDGRPWFVPLERNEKLRERL